MFGFKKNDITVRIEFPTNQIIKVLIVTALIFFTIKLQHIIILLFLSFIIMASTKPAAVFLSKKLKFPEPLAIIVVYISIIFIFGGIIYFISQPLAAEANRLSENAPELIEKAVERFPFLEGKVNGDSLSEIIKNLVVSVSQQFSNFGVAFNNALEIAFGAFSVLFQMISVLIISIYLFLDRKNILKSIISIFNFDEDAFYSAYDRIETQLGAWVRGQLFLAFVVGLMTWIGLTAAGVNFPLPLAVLAGLFEIIPVIGPIISAIPIMLIGFSMSPIKGVLSTIICLVVQQMENHLLVPTIMRRAVGLSPVVTLVSILIGSELLGLLGSIIAVPMAAMLSVFFNIYLETRGRSLEEK
jgi:predicted PurR-regulated permease PerM